jgi:thiamine-phosphate pyrophosphorylase
LRGNSPETTFSGCGSDRVPLVLPRFYPILDTATLETKGLSALSAATVLLDAGIRILQYRHKPAFTEARYREAAQIAHLCRDAGALFVMNDRADFAAILGAALHLGQDDLPPQAARKVVGPEALIGFSTHNEDQLRHTAGLPVDYLALGPVFTTGSKRNPDPHLGVTEWKRLRPLSPLPLVAIGGIHLESAAFVLESGADSVAVISDLLPPGQPSLDGLRRRAAEWLKATGGRV